MPDTRRWTSVDDWLAAAGQSWADIAESCPGSERGRSPRTIRRHPEADQAQRPASATTRTASTRTTGTPPPPLPDQP